MLRTGSWMAERIGRERGSSCVECTAGELARRRYLQFAWLATGGAVWSLRVRSPAPRKPTRRASSSCWRGTHPCRADRRLPPAGRSGCSRRRAVAHAAKRPLRAVRPPRRGRRRRARRTPIGPEDGPARGHARRGQSATRAAAHGGAAPGELPDHPRRARALRGPAQARPDLRVSLPDEEDVLTIGLNHAVMLVDTKSA